MAARGGRPLVLLDLAVPRDVDPAVASSRASRVIDIVALRERLAEHDDETAGDIARAHEIVAEEVRRYVVRRRGDELAPADPALRRRGDEVVPASSTATRPGCATSRPTSGRRSKRSRAASPPSSCTIRSWR